MSATKPGDLLWVTNIATPYRAPLWSALAEMHPLTVALLADSEKNRSWNVDVDEKGYDVVRLHARTVGTSGDSAIYAPSRQLLGLLRERPKAIVLDGWESPAYLSARWLAHRLRVPLIASYRSTLITHRFSHGPVPALRRWFFLGSNAVLTAGQASTSAVLRMGVPLPRIVEGFNTVDVSRFQAGAGLARQSLAHRPGHRFLYVGQLIKRKNLTALITAFKVMREPLDTLTLVGTGPDEAALRALAAALGVTSQVHFEGHLEGDELVAAYADAHTFVLPSAEEVWGLVVNEALASGLHAVVSDTCGIAPSIDGMPGVFISEPNAQAISVALEDSRFQWRGPLKDHPVTTHTPQALADVVLKTVSSISGDPSGNAASTTTRQPSMFRQRGEAHGTALDDQHTDPVHRASLARASEDH